MNKKEILTVVMIAMLAMPMEARADGFSWDAQTKTLTVTGTDIADYPAWPIVVGGTSVQKTDVEHLVVGSGVTSIGNYAFKNCTNLKTASLSNDVRSMGSSAFYGCTSLTTIKFPQNEDFKYIQNDAFRGCKSLTTITLPYNVDVIENQAFYDCPGLTSVDLGGVKKIGSWAFSGCTSLTSITIPTTCENIGEKAFSYCTNLKFARIYNLGECIKKYAFYTNTNIVIPSLVKRLKAYDLKNLDGFHVCYEGTKSEWDNVVKEQNYDAGVSVTFHWLVTVTFDMKGVGTAPDPQLVYWGIPNVVPEPAPEPAAYGYDFGGWYRDTGCNAKYIFNDKNNNNSIDGNKTLYAKWIPHVYDVSFDTGGKATNPEVQKVPMNEKATWPAVQSYSDDEGKKYYIEEWYTTSGCSGDPYDFNTPVDHSFTLYAKWAALTTKATATLTTTPTDARVGVTVTLTDANGRTFCEGEVPPGVYTMTITPNEHFCEFSGSITYKDRPAQGRQSTRGSQTGESQQGDTPDVGPGDGGDTPDVNPDEIYPTVIENSTKTYRLNLTSQDVEIKIELTEVLFPLKIGINPAGAATVPCYIQHGDGTRTYGIKEKEDNTEDDIEFGAGIYDFPYAGSNGLAITLSPNANEGYAFGTINLTKSSKTGSVALTPASATSITYSGEQDVTYSFPETDGGSEHRHYMGVTDIVFYKVLNIGTPMTDLNLTEGYTSGNVLTFDATVAPCEWPEDIITINGYQWYMNSTKSKEGAMAIPGANSTSYTIPTGKAAGTTEYYYCKVLFSGGVPHGGYTFSRFVAVTVSAADTPEPVTPEPVTHTITVSADPADGGTVTGGTSGTYALGTQFEFKATPNEGYRFVNWTIDGINGGSETTYPFVVNGDFSTVVAHFERIYPLSGDYVGFYDKDSNPITVAAEGETVTVSYNPYDPEDDNKVIIPSGKYFTGNYTSADGVTFTPIEGNTDATFIMPAKAVTVSAALADQEEYTLDLTTDEPQEIPESMWQLLYRNLEDNSIFDTETGEWFLDLNLDGSRDVLLEEDYDETAGTSTYRATRQAGADAIKTDLRFDLTYDIPLQYNSVLFNLVVDVVDLVRAIGEGKTQAEIDAIVNAIMQKK